jgi:hypothetical protein
MNVRTQLPLRNSLAACLCLAAVLLAAGCSVAPVDKTRSSSAVGPVRRVGSTDFAPFPVPAVYNGLGNAVYTQVQKAKTGSDPGSFHFTVRASMVFWLNCIGRGTAQLSSPGIGLQWSVPCTDGTSPAGITFSPKASALGHTASVLVSTTRQSHWEIRIDAAAPKGVSPVPDKIPSRTNPATATATAT